MKVMPKKCPTCPFRTGSKFENLAPMLAESALSEASRICHSTGSANALHHRTNKPAAICRGARDLQLGLFCALGVIFEPTDQAWDEAWEEIQRKKI